MASSVDGRATEWTLDRILGFTLRCQIQSSPGWEWRLQEAEADSSLRSDAEFMFSA